MDQILADQDHVIHVRENGVHHNTWCGRLLDDYTANPAQVTCMECIGGPSHIGIEDLLHATGLWILMAGLDATHNTVTKLEPVCFTKGTNVTEARWTGFTQKIAVHSVAYCRRDHVVLHMTNLIPVLMSSGDTLTIEVGRASLTEK